MIKYIVGLIGLAVWLFILHVGFYFDAGVFRTSSDPAFGENCGTFGKSSRKDCRYVQRTL